MNRESRRDFFGRWLGKGPQAPDLPTDGPAGASSTAPRAGAAPGATSSFSLEAFYAARTPQRLPPISIRPSVLHYAQQGTRVGSPPPHAPPLLAEDPLYGRLSAALTSGDGSTENAPTGSPRPRRSSGLR